MTNATLQATFPASVLDEVDVLEQMRQADRADRVLLALVGCTAVATLLLAAAISLAR